MTQGGEKPAEAEQYRSYLEGLAYRMLGSMAEAQDAVQDAFLRLAETGEAAVETPRAWLAAVVTNRCIDILRSARRQRETYIGEWLPEPVATDADGNPELAAERADSLTLAFLVLLEELTPLERAAYLLHDIFDYDYAETARALERSEAACRQLASRARRRIEADRPEPPDPAPEVASSEVLMRFVSAVQEGDAAGLMTMFTDDIVMWNDGGGKAKAALNPIYGPDNVARFFIGTMDKRPADLVWAFREVNGEPGFVGHYADGRPYAVVAFDIAGGRIAGIRTVVNPDKLGAFA